MPPTTSRPRRYVMRTRADGVARTRDHVLDATIALAYEAPLRAITLDRVAERSGVSVQTILRHFGNRDGLAVAAHERATELVLAERPADPDRRGPALEALIDHYELRGDGVLLLLGQEPWEPLARTITDAGKKLHREWVARLFAPPLEAAADPDALLDLLVIATDVYAWKLLRRDAGRTREETLQRMTALIDAIVRTAAPSVERTGTGAQEPRP